MVSHERIISKLKSLPHQEPPGDFTVRLMAALAKRERVVVPVDRFAWHSAFELTPESTISREECVFYLSAAGLFHGILGLAYMMGLLKFTHNLLPLKGLIAQPIMAFGLSIYLIFLAVQYHRGQALTARQVEIFIWLYMALLMAGGIFLQWMMGVGIMAGVVICTTGMGMLIGFFLAGVLQRYPKMQQERSEFINGLPSNGQ
jgi:hypothetical protein